jgi:hypothetical protein
MQNNHMMQQVIDPYGNVSDDGNASQYYHNAPPDAGEPPTRIGKRLWATCTTLGSSLTSYYQGCVDYYGFYPVSSFFSAIWPSFL